MPRAFTEKEKEYIKERLIDAAKHCLFQYGVRKTTIDELVKLANIPKGTFYLFYQTKELLFYDVFRIFHDEIQADLVTMVKQHKPVNPEELTELIFSLYKKIDNSFMLKPIAGGEFDLLMNKLPELMVRDHIEKDDFMMDEILDLLPNIQNRNKEIFSAALRGIFIMMIHKHEIGEEVFDSALKITIHGVVIQIFDAE